ncbi:hypothetical protein [Rhizobium sp. A37_96]
MFSVPGGGEHRSFAHNRRAPPPARHHAQEYPHIISSIAGCRQTLLLQASAYALTQHFLIKRFLNILQQKL